MKGGALENARHTDGGIPGGSGLCLKGGDVDPFNSETYSGADGGAVER